MEDFSSFYDWATSKGGYEEGLTIDRKNVNKGYYPENCRFTGNDVQSRNKRSSQLYTIDGVTKNQVDWCREYNMVPTTFRYRIRRGMSVKEALTKPVKRKKEGEII